MGGIETLPWLILLREMTVKVAISYRRDDSAAITGRIFDRLSARLGRESVFRDIDSIPVGENFEKKIEYVLSQCLVFIAVVGPDWCGRQRRTYRIKQGDDFVRMEVETALARGIAIIPVLVEGASMPKRAQLPNSLQNFPLLNALRMIPAGTSIITSASYLTASKSSCSATVWQRPRCVQRRPRHHRLSTGSPKNYLACRRLKAHLPFRLLYPRRQRPRPTHLKCPPAIRPRRWCRPHQAGSSSPRPPASSCRHAFPSFLE